MTKIPCGKTRGLKEGEKPWEVWQTPDGQWKWEVLKKYQKDDDKPYARAHCRVTSPFVPNGELGDVYIDQYKKYGILVEDNKDEE